MAPTPPGLRRDKPLYQAVFDSLRQKLGDGKWEVGDVFPSEAELIQLYGASRITIRHALQKLEAQGFINRTATRRTTVAALSPHRQRPLVVRSIDDIIAMVSDARLDVQSWRTERSSADAELLGLPPRTDLYCLRSVLFRNEAPILRSIIYFPPEIGSRLTRDMFNDVIVFRVLGRELGVFLKDVWVTISAELANADDAAQLGCARGDPLLVTQLLYHSDGGQPVELAYSRRSGDDAQFSTRLSTFAGDA